MAFGFLIMMICLCGIVGIMNNMTKEERRKKAKEIGRQTGYKKLGIKVEKKDEHTWIVKKDTN